MAEAACMLEHSSFSVTDLIRDYEIFILGQLSVIFLDSLSLFYNYATVNIFKEVYLAHVKYGKIFLHPLVRNKSDELV